MVDKYRSTNYSNCQNQRILQKKIEFYTDSITQLATISEVHCTGLYNLALGQFLLYARFMLIVWTLLLYSAARRGR